MSRKDKDSTDISFLIKKYFTFIFLRFGLSFVHN